MVFELQQLAALMARKELKALFLYFLASKGHSGDCYGNWLA